MEVPDAAVDVEQDDVEMDGDDVSSEGEDYIDGGEESDDDDRDYRETMHRNWQIVQKLRRDDSSVTTLRLHWYQDEFGDAEEEDIYYAGCVDWEAEGWCFGESTHLTNLSVNGPGGAFQPAPSDAAVRNFEELLLGVGRSRSLEHIRIHHCFLKNGAAIEKLHSFFLENSNLCTLELSHCVVDDENIRSLASVLAQCKTSSFACSLTKFVFEGCELKDEVAGELIASLMGHRKLVELHFDGDGICEAPAVGKDGCIAIGNLLQSSSSRLNDLYLENIYLGDDVGAVALGNGLAKNNTLRKLHLKDNNLGDAGAIAALVKGLAKNYSLQQLYLEENDLGDAGATALGNGLESILQNPSSSLVELHLGRSKMNDEGVIGLAKGLAKNSTLKDLDLSSNKSITGSGWRSFFALLQQNPSSAIDKLLLHENNIDDDSAVEMASVVANNMPMLKILNLHSNASITAIGWRALPTAFHEHNNIEELNICPNKIDDEGGEAISRALANSSTLKTLILASSNGVSSTGWVGVLQNLLQNRNSALEELDLYNNTVDEHGVAIIVDNLPHHNSFKNLCLGKNMSISKRGLLLLPDLLQNPNCSLLTLDVNENNIDDEVAASLARALGGNSTLETLYIDANEDITSTGWDAFYNVLWDKSSIANTFRSNHTLECLVDLRYDWENMDLLSSDLNSVLEMNQNEHKFEVARLKILHHHFLGGASVNIQEFVSMEWAVLPRAISWIGMDDSGHPLLYELVRGLPSLFEFGGEAKAAGAKRKRV